MVRERIPEASGGMALVYIGAVQSLKLPNSTPCMCQLIR